MAADLIGVDSLSLKVTVRHASISRTNCCSRLPKKPPPNPDADTSHAAFSTASSSELPVKLAAFQLCSGVSFLSPFTQNAPVSSVS